MREDYQLTIIVDGINLPPATFNLAGEEFHIPYNFLPEVERKLGLGPFSVQRPYGSPYPSHTQIAVPSKKYRSVRRILEKYGGKK